MISKHNLILWRTHKSLFPAFVAMTFVFIACGSGASGGETSKDENSLTNFLALSDIHFNPYYDPSLIHDLIKTDAEHWDTVFEKSSVKSFGYYGSHGPFWDTGYPLFKSALASMKAANPDPEFITVNGDFLAHEFEPTFQSLSGTTHLDSLKNFTIKTLEYIVGSLAKTFPNAPLFPTLGNNDAFCGDYEIRTPGTFLTRSAPIWLKQLKGYVDEAEFNQTYTHGGYFVSTNPLNAKHKIISLNTVILSPKHFERTDFCGGVPDTATIRPVAEAQFSWLEDQLKAALGNNEKVWLMFHIPPGFDSWSTHRNNENLPASQCQSTQPSSFYDLDFNSQYLSIVNKYKSVIVAQFGGHTHMDNFMVLGGDQTPYSFVHIQPGITPINYNNPGFINYDFDASTGELKNYEVHGFNQVQSATAPGWKAEYTFSRAYKAKNLTAQSLTQVYKNFLTDSVARTRYLEYYVVEDSASAPTMKEWPYYYCAFGNQRVKDYNDCICKMGN